MKELEDQPWFPARFRNAQTAFIGFVVARFGIYKPFTAWLKSAGLQHRSMFDLCSGSGEPAVGIYKQSQLFSTLTLSDKFPPGGYAEQADIHYLPESADVTEMQFSNGHCYTMFNALHHFSDSEKKTISGKIIRSGSEAVFAEILQPNIICMLKVVLATTAGVWLLTPFVRPLSFSNLFFTYLLPVNVLSITYDGVVSVLKSRSESQYRKLFSDMGERVEVARSGTLLAPLVLIRIKAI